MTDRPYWDAFYRAAHPDIEAPSTFATWCLPLLAPESRVIEFGCGNGRDAIYFARHAQQVIACDQSEIAIESLSAREYPGCIHRPTFVVCDFSRLADGQFNTVDVVYSRFTLHAVTQAEATAALAWAWRNLRSGGLLVVEVRSINGDLYGKGEPRERDAFVYNGHYRRFVRLDELTAELSNLGFTIEQAFESAGLAVHKDDDPVLIRIAARRT
jgi:ubiquinone/menaquinone biosynthesis C-methylase UbiE